MRGELQLEIRANFFARPGHLSREMRSDFIPRAGDLLGHALGGLFPRAFALALDRFLPALEQRFRRCEVLPFRFFGHALQRLRSVRRRFFNGALRLALELRLQFSQQRAFDLPGLGLFARDGSGESKCRCGRLVRSISFAHFTIALEDF